MNEELAHKKKSCLVIKSSVVFVRTFSVPSSFVLYCFLCLLAPHEIDAAFLSEKEVTLCTVFKMYSILQQFQLATRNIQEV